MSRVYVIGLCLLLAACSGDDDNPLAPVFPPADLEGTFRFVANDAASCGCYTSGLWGGDFVVVISGDLFEMRLPNGATWAVGGFNEVEATATAIRTEGPLNNCQIRSTFRLRFVNRNEITGRVDYLVSKTGEADCTTSRPVEGERQ